MLIKKFIAPNLPEALSKVKDDFGDEAVILKTKFNNKPDGVGREARYVEVTAAIDKTPVEKQPVEKTTVPKVNNRLKASAPKPVQKPQPETVESLTPPNLKTPSELLAEMRKDLSVVLKNIDESRRESLFGRPSAVQMEVGKNLLEKHLPEPLILDLLRRAENVGNLGADDYTNLVIKNLAESLGVGIPIKIAETGPTVVMLVGPPGSGKTSAAARLAFQFSIETKSDVTLVTTDCFRADSREQLMALANVIGCGFTATSSPEELAVLLKTIKQGLVIIDTTGISSKADQNELHALVGAANPHEIHLVVPADIPDGDITAFLKNNSIVEVDRLFITKLDQTSYRGGVIGSAVRHNLKFSYQSASRELPGNIALFDPSTFVSALAPTVELVKQTENTNVEVVS